MNTAKNIHTMDPAQRAAALAAVRRAGMGRRIYHVQPSRPGGFIEWPGRQLVGQARIRAVLCRQFRAWFGSPPSFTWAVDGQQGEAWDDRGNRLAIHQINDR